MDRRGFLRAGGVAFIGTVTGCLGDGDGSERSGPDAGQRFGGHPATADIESQPVQGELGGHLVPAFEDPSCPRCATLHEETVPAIRSNIVAAALGG